MTPSRFDAMKASFAEPPWSNLPLGEKVKILRERQGLTQQQLADASAITQATISRLEGNKVKQLSSGRLRRLAAALKVSTDLLVGSIFEQVEARIFRPPHAGFEERLDYSEERLDYIVSVFRQLSNKRKEELKDFAQFLKEKEEGSKREQREKFERWLDEREPSGKQRSSEREKKGGL